MSNGFEKLLADEQAFKLNVVQSLAELKVGQESMQKSLDTYVESNDKRVADDESTLATLGICLNGQVGKPETGLFWQVGMLKKYWIVFTSIIVFIGYFAVDLVKEYVTSFFKRGGN